MKRSKRSFKRIVVEKHPSLSIIFIYNIVTILVALLFYPLIPVVLNYPPESINTRFDVEVSYISYAHQYIVIIFICILVGSIILRLALKGVDDWVKLVNKEQTYKDSVKLKKIRKKCLNLPYIIYLCQLVIPLFAIIFILTLIVHLPTASQKLILIFKISVLIFSFGTLAALISHIYSKRIFTKILLNTYQNAEREGIRISLRSKVFLQILPMFIVATLFTSLVGYSRLVKEIGNRTFKSYKAQLSDIAGRVQLIKNSDQALSALNSIKLDNPRDYKFVISPTGSILPVGYHPLSAFFIKYMKEISPKYNGHVYDYYGIDTQGAVVRIKGDVGYWTIGVKYEVVSKETLTFLIVSFIILFGLNAFVLSYFSNTLAGEMSMVTRSLAEIAEGGNVNLDKKLAVTSNDEIGDLVVAFNKIQDLEKENINSMKEKQAILMEQERLASLGQLIGGIAHNLKTPIMSISGAVEGLKDLVEEYDESIDDEDVTKEDHHEIASDMMTWINKIKPHCSYMSDVITAVKGQAVQFNSSSSISFTLDELVKRIDILMKHELIKYNCTMNMDFQVDLKTELKGEVNNLVQIFDNIIINAIHAYEGKRGVIDFKIVRNGDNIEFIIADYGKGIPEEIKDKLFKEMVTTKGKNGTGLGLYMSYSTIKGRFGGNMWFTSREGKGTTFYVSIPCLKKAEANEEVV